MTPETMSKDVVEKTKRLKAFVTNLGADLVGIADLSLYRDQYEFSEHLLRKFPYAVSIAMRLSNAVVDGITAEDPTEAYVHHYRTVNIMLDNVALRAANFCQTEGYYALPVPAAHVSDEERLLGAVSHKAIAVLAGLGWQGKSLLVINENFGPRIRLVSVLTTVPLNPDKSMKNLCGDCMACIKACPINAIRETPSQKSAPSRQEALDVQACNRRLLEIASNPRYGVRICGVCIKVCPWGKRQNRLEENTTV
ncbi:MAG: 4Fe-4S double cluster binding domain-containing protein [Candidatus Bathyarchaeota archaeon]|jgi:epoxyqueuosine reductase QueG